MQQAERERVEQQIREVLASETSAIKLSNLLFTPDGLFNRIAHTEVERRNLLMTSLFREAQARLSELMRIEAREFANDVDVRVAQLESPFSSKRELSTTIADQEGVGRHAASGQ